ELARDPQDPVLWSLRGMDLLVETHDGPGSTSIQDLLIQRFVDSHEATVYSFLERDEAQAKRASWLRTPRVRRLAIDEGRVSGFTWVWLRSRRAEGA
ncbi:MAG: hypothetical protein K2W96_11155, partial [Gemmataceae bacterium]|nr:hypothetical protein [Gemmataceae bacterium]